jgi:hypothetical protein
MIAINNLEARLEDAFSTLPGGASSSRGWPTLAELVSAMHDPSIFDGGADARATAHKERASSPVDLYVRFAGTCLTTGLELCDQIRRRFAHLYGTADPSAVDEVGEKARHLGRLECEALVIRSSLDASNVKILTANPVRAVAIAAAGVNVARRAALLYLELGRRPWLPDLETALELISVSNTRFGGIDAVTVKLGEALIMETSSMSITNDRR